MTDCPYARSDMTPCVLRDGAMCWALTSNDEPICVGCERSPETLAALGVPPPDLPALLSAVAPRPKARRKRAP